MCHLIKFYRFHVKDAEGAVPGGASKIASGHGAGS